MQNYVQRILRLHVWMLRIYLIFMVIKFSQAYTQFI